MKRVITTLSSLFLLTSVSWAQVKADNTKMNAREYAGDSPVTADQQGTSINDLDTTRRIRESLIKDKSLSTYAHNVKVITINGQVRLKGPVASQTEIDKIMLQAQSVAGSNQVVNELELTSTTK